MDSELRKDTLTVSQPEAVTSGDFHNQSPTPLPIDFKALVQEAGDGALNDVEMNWKWADLPRAFGEYTVDIFIADLLCHGQHEMTVKELAVGLGLCHPDGSWI